VFTLWASACLDTAESLDSDMLMCDLALDSAF
jgi:hypothetical protein